jgi:NADH:ubiquinone oxidoreductase subunit 6 (subunit J)
VTVADALMLALGLIAVGSGALVVSSSHLVRAGLYLVISLGAIAGLYLVLGAELVAWVQVLVYVGAVVVLLLFAVMLTRAPIGPSTDLDRPAGPAALIGAGVGVGLAALLADAFHWTRYDLPPTGTAERVGAQIFGGWVLPFEVLSILLLAALVGAIVLSRPDLGARPDPEAAQIPATVPPPDPTAESAAVVARLERIAARQANAQARLRQTAAEQRAATTEPATTEPATTEPATTEPADPSPTASAAAGGAKPSAGTAVQDALKGRAADVIFGAQSRRIPLGVDTPPEPGTTRDDIIEGTATETGPRRPAGGRPGSARSSSNRPEIEGSARGSSSRPEIEGSARGSSSRPAIEGSAAESSPPGRSGSARGSSNRPAIHGSATETGPTDRAEPSRRPTRPAIEGSAADDDQPTLGESRPRRGVTGPSNRPALPARDDKAGDKPTSKPDDKPTSKPGDKPTSKPDDKPEGDA